MHRQASDATSQLGQHHLRDPDGPISLYGPLVSDGIHVRRQASDATSQLAAAAEGLASAQKEVVDLKALAAERQKRFVMLNGTFKKKEEGLRERTGAAERQVAAAQQAVDMAVAASQAAAKVGRGCTCLCEATHALLLLLHKLLPRCGVTAQVYAENR